MSDKPERLRKLDNNKLIDVVKNYRQYGYDETIRSMAIALLEARGINKEELQLSGNFENTTYDKAIDIYSSFKRNSTIAFITYAVLLLINILFLKPFNNVDLTGMLVLLLKLAVLAIFFIFLIRSFLNQHHFYKLIGEDFGTEGIVVYIFLGMPLYFLMYFYFKSQMKERMALIK